MCIIFMPTIFKPLSSNRDRMRPQMARWTASGLNKMRVRSMVGELRTSSCFGRGIIATGVLILVAIPTGCRIQRSNQLKDTRQEIILADRQDRLAVMKRQQFRIEAAIEQLQMDLQGSQTELDQATARILPLSTDLGQKLRFIRTMEEDLVVARKQQAELETLRKKAAGFQSQLTEAKAAIAAADSKLAAQQADLAKKTAAVKELGQHLAAFAELEAKVKKLLDDSGAKASAPVGPTTPAKKK